MTGSSKLEDEILIPLVNQIVNNFISYKLLRYLKELCNDCELNKTLSVVNQLQTNGRQIMQAIRENEIDYGNKGHGVEGDNGKYGGNSKGDGNGCTGMGFTEGLNGIPMNPLLMNNNKTFGGSDANANKGNVGGDMNCDAEDLNNDKAERAQFQNFRSPQKKVMKVSPNAYKNESKIQVESYEPKQAAQNLSGEKLNKASQQVQTQPNQNRTLFNSIENTASNNKNQLYDARKDFFFDNFIKRINLPETKQEIKVEQDELEEKIILRQKEKIRVKGLRAEQNKYAHLEHKNPRQNDKQKNLQKTKLENIKSNKDPRLNNPAYLVRDSKEELAKTKKQSNKKKTFGNEMTNNNRVMKQSRRILKNAFGHQMVYIKKEKVDTQDKSQIVINLKNAGANLIQAQHGFHDSETDFQGLSDEEKQNNQKSDNKPFGVAFERKKTESGTISERKRLYSIEGPGSARKNRGDYSKSTKKHLATPRQETTLKKKKREKAVINLDSEDDENSNFQTMEDWNANIIAFNTPYKGEDETNNFQKNMKSSYKRQLNFDPLLSSNNNHKNGISRVIEDSNNQSRMLEEDLPKTSHNKSGQLAQPQKASQYKNTNVLTIDEDRRGSANKSPLFNPENCTIDPEFDSRFSSGIKRSDGLIQEEQNMIKKSIKSRRMVNGVN